MASLSKTLYLEQGVSNVQKKKVLENNKIIINSWNFKEYWNPVSP